MPTLGVAQVGVMVGAIVTGHHGARRSVEPFLARHGTEQAKRAAEAGLHRQRNAAAWERE